MRASGRPPLRRIILLTAAVAVIGGAAALPAGPGDALAAALVALLIFGGVNFGVWFGWGTWEKRPRKLSFEFVWLTLAVAVALSFFAVQASESGFERAAIDAAPAAVILAVWFVLRRFPGTRTR